MDEGDPDVVMVVSEETEPGFCWKEVPPQHMLLAQHPGQVVIRPLPCELGLEPPRHASAVPVKKTV